MRQLRIYKTITKRESESINKYFAEVSAITMLSEKEEHELFNKISNGDEKAFNRVIEANLRFVISVAKQYQNKGINLEDLINEGNIGLIKSVQKFDVTRGFKFISYAVWWIRQCIMQSIAEHSRIIRLPGNHINSINKINRVGARLEQDLEREPTDKELSEALDGLDVKIKDSIIFNIKMTSLDAPLKDGEDLLLSDIIENPDSISPDNFFIKESMSRDIESVLKKFSNRQRTILGCYFGIMGFPLLTLEEIGDYYKLTRERVRQIRDLGIRKLQSRNNSKVLKQHIN